jgi:hypothetical protein
MAPIKAAGKYRMEGKTYVVQDGDIIHFQFSKHSSDATIVNEQESLTGVLDVAPKK